MNELGFEKKTIHVPGKYRKSHENEKQWCYIRGNDEDRKKLIILNELNPSDFL